LSHLGCILRFARVGEAMPNPKTITAWHIHNRRLGVTLIELIIVLTIIAMLVTLLLPAVHMVRRASRITACANNQRQFAIGMQGYIEIHRFIPGPPVESHPSGWAIELLPFVEEILVHNSFDTAQVLVSPRNLAAAAHRPNIFICPETEYRPSTTPGVEVTNYLMMVNKKERPLFRTYWRMVDAPEGSRFPWCLSPEKGSPEDEYPPPHDGTPFGL
jgi:prepilin-type N-terminal cleavage/methylation domain-containing protein